MPHVVVKLWPDKSAEQKQELADAITNDIVKIMHYREESISIAMEEIRPQDWAEQVYRPEIEGRLEQLYKKPGYRVEDLPS